MVPRGRLDISAADLVWALSACFRSRRPAAVSVQSLWPNWHVLAALSVRTAWDAWLAEQRWPVGDEVLVSAVTIPDMLRIIREHGLVPVPITVNFESLAVPACELERRITSRTRAALVAHLFGSRMPIGPLADVCHKHGIQFVEDAAQAFAGPDPFASSESDVVLLSFGPIKTCTSLGGAVVLVRDSEMALRIAQRLTNYSRQPTWEFFVRVLKMLLLQALTWPPAFKALVCVLTACGLEWDQQLSSMTRGFAGQQFWDRLRRQPPEAMLALLERRLQNYSVRSVNERVGRANLLWSRIGAVERPGLAAAEHTHWVLPIAPSEPEQLVKTLRRRGFDATRLASSMVQAADETCPEDARWNRLVYLPNHPAADPVKLTAAIQSFDETAMACAVTPHARE